MPPPGPDEKTLQFLKQAFQRHYKSAALEPPDQMVRREFAFLPFTGGLMQRHLGFANLNDLRTHLLARAPAHTYYSSAYYERPGAPTMDEKGWQGADLVFDLDADHLPGAKGMSYPQMLQEVKRLFLRLLDEFLLGDLGFRENDVLTVFSGGRGYHAHVRNPRVLPLGSHERRELVDYITGKGLDVKELIQHRPIDVKEFKGVKRVTQTVRFPRADEPGWPGRLTRAFEAWLEDLWTKPPDEAKKEIAAATGSSPQRVGELYRRIFNDRDLARDRLLAKLREGFVEFFPTETESGLATLRAIAETRGVPLGKGETDEPVTSDVKRLIRMPTSLHGKTGLEVMAMSRAALDDFDPLRDAVPEVFTDTPVKVELRQPFEGALRSERFNLGPGVTEVPEYAAVFLASRGVARIEAVR